MATIDKTADTAFTLCWGRGDSDAKSFTIKDSAGVAINIAGFSFQLTVSSDKNPPDQVGEQFTIVGVIVSAPNGIISFSPTPTDTDIAPTTYFYDIEQTNVSGAIKTLVKGKAIIIQDITKV